MPEQRYRILVDLGGWQAGSIVTASDLGGSMIDPSPEDIAAMVAAGYLEPA